MTKNIENERFNYFYNTWLQAVKYISKEIEKSKYDYYYKSIDNHFYQNISKDYFDKIKTKEFFKKYIFNEKFYSFESEFSIHYLVIKDNFTYRNKTFLSLLLKIIHYSIGAYLFKLTEEFYQYIKSDKIESYYSADIKITNKSNDISASKNSTKYYNQYSKFRSSIQKVIRNTDNNTFVIKLDIKNYYDNINLNIMLNKLFNNLRYLFKEKSYFDEKTINFIKKFYLYIQNNSNGIPQIDRDIFASFESNIYMRLIDLELFEPIMSRYREYFNYKIIQYVDDTYIVINFKNGRKNENILVNIIRNISLKLHDEFKLDLNNNKCNIYNLGNVEEIADLKEKVKYVSSDFFYESTNANIAINAINNELDNAMKTSSYDLNIKTYIFNKIYDKSVQEFLKNDSQEKLKLINLLHFLDFNKYPSLVNNIVCMCSSLNNQDLINKLNDFVNSNATLSKNFYLVMRANNLINYNKNLSLVDMEHQDLNKINFYFNLSEEQANKIMSDDAINIIFKRKLAEISDSYELAINYLYNEFQTNIYNLDTLINTDKELRNYRVNNICDFLKIKNIDTELIVQVRNFSDIRNNNGISHSNSVMITKDKYYFFKKIIGEIYRQL